MAMTQAQKEADKRYRERHQVITKSISYKKEEISEGKRLLSYLDQTGQSANGYIKGLIKADLDSKRIRYEQINQVEPDDK